MNSKKLLFTFAIALVGAFVGVFTYSRLIGPTTKVVTVNQPPVAHLAGMQVGGYPDLTFAAEKSVHAVVHVKVTSTTKGFSSDDPFYNFFFGPNGGNPQPQQQMGFGSGVITSADGYIITNNHVIDNADQIEVVLNDKREYKAKLVGTDPTTDIALLKIDEEGLPFLTFGNSDALKVGEWVLAVGNPFNLTSTVTAGIVSAKSRSINILSGGQNKMGIEAFIQTDAAVNPGNSGGALVNTSGELVGINTAIASQTGSYSGYSFAVPVSIVSKIVNDIKEYGVVQRALLGVSIRDIDKTLAEEKDIDKIEGVYVAAVGPTSGAKEAGMLADDIILSIDDERVNSVPELQEKIGRHRPGDKVKVLVKRDGKEKLLNVQLRNTDGSTSLVKPQDLAVVLGATLKELSDDEKAKLQLRSGVKVVALKEGKLQASGVREGYVITKANHMPVSSVDDFRQIVNDADAEGGLLLAGLYPNGRTQFYAINLTE